MKCHPGGDWNRVGVVGKNLPLDLQMSTTDHAETWNRHWVLKSIASQPMACVASPALTMEVNFSLIYFDLKLLLSLSYLKWNLLCGSNIYIRPMALWWHVVLARASWDVLGICYGLTEQMLSDGQTLGVKSNFSKRSKSPLPKFKRWDSEASWSEKCVLQNPGCLDYTIQSCGDYDKP